MKIGRKETRVPLIQGGMGIGISLGGLAGAVAREGGVGIISAAQPGFREPDFYRHPLQANLRAMEQEFQKARKIAPKGVIGFNIMVAMNHYREYVQQAVRLGADIIISGAGLPVDLPHYVKEAIEQSEDYPGDVCQSPAEGKDCTGTAAAGRGTLEMPALAPIVSSEKSAAVILKYWDRKYQRMPDLIVIEGPLAGGHLGFSRAQLEQYRSEGIEAYEAEMQSIRNRVQEYETKYDQKIGIVAAGGIEDAAAMERMLQLGMDGVQVASRFVTTLECDADMAYKQKYLEAEAEDIVLIQSPVGMPGRAVQNDFTRAAAGKGNAEKAQARQDAKAAAQADRGPAEQDGVAADKSKLSPTRCTGCLAKCNPRETPYCITEALIRAAKGDTDWGLVFCGGRIGAQNKIETVKEVMDSFARRD